VGAKARRRLAATPVTLIDCRLEGRRRELKMRYLGGVAEHDVPDFETAWSMVVSLFPDVPANSQGARLPPDPSGAPLQ
jgi:hypothetical protein